MSRTRTVPTPHGDARLDVHRAAEPVATLLLTHGAGGGIDAPDLQALARDLPERTADRPTLERRVRAWQRSRDDAAVTADWRFNTADARIRLRKLYPTMQA